MAIAVVGWSFYVWKFQQYPPVGIYIAILGALGVIVTIFPPEHNWEKALWLGVFFALMAFEIHNLYKHDADQAREQKEDRLAERLAFDNEMVAFGKVLQQGQDNLQAILKQQNEHFDKTIKAMLSSQRAEHDHFNSLLSKESELYEHEEQLAESLHGRLIPGSEPTPQNRCRSVTAKELLVLWGVSGQEPNAQIVTHFPHVVLASQRFGPVLTLERDGSSIVVFLDIRSNDGRVIARLNRDGWVVNRNNYLEMKKDKSSLVVIDEFGHEVINVHYYNTHAILVSGQNVGLRGMSGGCIETEGGIADVLIP